MDDVRRPIYSTLTLPLRDRLRNEISREDCAVQDVVSWARTKRIGWKDHVNCMNRERLAKWSKTEIPLDTKLRTTISKMVRTLGLYIPRNIQPAIAESNRIWT